MQHKKTEIYQAIEDFINDYVDANGTTPTMSEIGEALGVHKSTISRYVAVMEEQGLAFCDDHRRVLTRQLRNDLSDLTRTPVRGSRFAPVIGSVVCGTPNESDSYLEETVRLPKSLFGKGPLFILRASGDSMIEAGIEDGDLVVVRQTQEAQPGDIVVVVTDDVTSLKGYFPEPEKKRIRLQPANSSMEPMYFKDVVIQGVAVKVIKDIRTDCF